MSGPSPIRKPVARVASIGLDQASQGILRDCFSSFNIQVVPIEDAAERLRREKFEACVLRLDAGAAAILEAARNSRSNRRIVIYGVAADSRQALRFSKYGINAVFDDPIQRQPALKIVRATHLLVLNELRRYVRVPVVLGVTLQCLGREYLTTSREVSGGGMSLESDAHFPDNQAMTVSFTLPDAPAIRVDAFLAWLRPSDSMIGIRFDPADERRLAVREWIDNYLEFS